jgi:hypothetical protein
MTKSGGIRMTSYAQNDADKPMAELKSAWEIAQEKADKLGNLSAEELRQQGEEKCRQIGEAIAQRYLDNVEPLDLGIELDKHLEEERELIKRAVASRLIRAMDLRFFAALRMTGNEGFRMTDKLEKTIQGIASLEPQSRAITERLRQLFQEYEGATREARQEIERKDKEILHRLRISGTAVGDINVEARPQWQQTWQRLRKPFEPRLDNLKQELINCIEQGQELRM